MPLRERDIELYARQIVIPDIGVQGQERLLAASVNVAGNGAAAAAALVYLRAAGVTTQQAPAATLNLDLHEDNEPAPGSEAAARAAARGCEAACAAMAQILGLGSEESSGGLGSLEKALA